MAQTDLPVLIPKGERNLSGEDAGIAAGTDSIPEGDLGEKVVDVVHGMV